MARETPPSTGTGGPLAADRWIEHLERHLRIAARGEDPEGVHQLRVAAARLRVWLRLGQRRMLDDDLRWLRDSAGELRDLDVAIGAGGPKPFVEALRKRWRKARVGLIEALDSPRLRGLREALACAAPVDRVLARRVSARWRRKLRRQGEAIDWIHSPAGDLHDLRKRTRRLRFALEWIERPVPEVKKFADQLGDLHDLDVLHERITSGEWASSHLPPLDEVEAQIDAHREELGPAWRSVRKTL